MINFQTLNQLFLAILALMLASLYVGSVSMKQIGGYTTTARFWRLSLGTRSVSYLLWALLPIAGPLCGAGANMLFIFSSGCLALLFRSWRTEVSREVVLLVALCALLVGGLHLVAQRAESSYVMRLLVTGSAGIVFSVWELVELLKHVRKDREPALKLVIAVVLIQKLLAIAALIATLRYANGSQHFLTDNTTKSIYFTWCVLGFHLVIYLVVGSYLYRKALWNQHSAVSEQAKLRQLLDEREKLLSSLVAANRVTSSGALSASLAHQLSQPLTAALMQLGLMKHIVTNKNEADHTLVNLLESVLKDIAQLKHILENIRAIFRQRPSNIQSCDLSQLVSQTVQALDNRLREANVRVIYLKTQPMVAEIAAGEIQQVLINLLNNATESLEHTAGQGKTIWIDLVDTGERINLSVSDNGAGIPPEFADQIFELARSDKEGGMGIGLWIAKHIVEERHHGRLWLDTLFAPGARFVMELPKATPLISGNSASSGTALTASATALDGRID